MAAEWFMDGLAVWPVIVPLAAAAVAVLLRRWPLLQRGAMEAAVVAMLLAAALLLWRTSGGNTLVMRFGGWARPFSVTFVADALSSML